MAQSVHDLEELRHRLDALESEMGSAYDYIDRGLPDADQSSATWEQIEENKLTILNLREDMETTIRYG